MKKIILLSMFSLLLCVWHAHAEDVPQTVPYTVSAAHDYKNLRVFLLKAPDCQTCFDGKPVLTLDEALEKKLITVYETKTVNTLAIENHSTTDAIFIQAGDIVKGGQQDRVLAQDVLLKPKSGKIDISSFCVEQGRWQKRGNENSEKFASSKYRINSKDLKMSSQVDKDQSQVWNYVEKTKAKMSDANGTSVNSADSDSSLQLALENKDFNKKVSEYQNALQDIVHASPDAIGYVFVINGKINSGDAYATHALLQKLWPKLLLAMAQEAFAESKTEQALAVVDAQAQVQSFLNTAHYKTTLKEKSVVADTEVLVSESMEAVFTKSRPQHRKNNTDWFHSSYIKKEILVNHD